MKSMMLRQQTAFNPDPTNVNDILNELFITICRVELMRKKVLWKFLQIYGLISNWVILSAREEIIW